MSRENDERTVYFDPSMLEQLQGGGSKKKTLVIVDNGGINEIDLSGYADAVYPFGRSADNSIVINSEIVSGHHGEVCMSGGVFYIKDTASFIRQRQTSITAVTGETW